MLGTLFLFMKPPDGVGDDSEMTQIKATTVPKQGLHAARMNPLPCGSPDGAVEVDLAELTVPLACTVSIKGVAPVIPAERLAETFTGYLPFPAVLYTLTSRADVHLEAP